MVIRRGDIWWVDFGEARGGSRAAFRRPAVIVQSDHINRTAIRTTIVVPLTSSQERRHPPQNILLPAKATRLTRDSYAVPTEIEVVEKGELLDRVGRLPDRWLDLIDQSLLDIFDLTG